MLQNITFGTYIFFGLITTLGAAFIAFYVPETKQLSLGKPPSPSFISASSVQLSNALQTEEMDVIFGSEGVAAADFERQAEINREIGLDDALGRLGGGSGGGSGGGGGEKDVEYYEAERFSKEKL
jgi:hypothetical protein